MWLPHHESIESFVQVGLLKFGPFHLTPAQTVGHSVFLRHLYAQEDDLVDILLFCTKCGGFTGHDIKVVLNHYHSSCVQCQHIYWAWAIPGALHSCYACDKQTPLYHNYCDQCGCAAPHGYDRAPMYDEEPDFYQPWGGTALPAAPPVEDGYDYHMPLETLTPANTEGMTVAEIESLPF